MRLYLAFVAVLAGFLCGCAPKQPEKAMYLVPELTDVKLAKRCKFDAKNNKPLEKCDFRLIVNGLEVK